MPKPCSKPSISLHFTQSKTQWPYNDPFPAAEAALVVETDLVVHYPHSLMVHSSNSAFFGVLWMAQTHSHSASAPAVFSDWYLIFSFTPF